MANGRDNNNKSSVFFAAAVTQAMQSSGRANWRSSALFNRLWLQSQQLCVYQASAGVSQLAWNTPSAQAPATVGAGDHLHCCTCQHKHSEAKKLAATHVTCDDSTTEHQALREENVVVSQGVLLLPDVRYCDGCRRVTPHNPEAAAVATTTAGVMPLAGGQRFRTA